MLEFLKKIQTTIDIVKQIIRFVSLINSLKKESFKKKLIVISLLKMIIKLSISSGLKIIKEMFIKLKVKNQNIYLDKLKFIYFL